MKTTKLFLFLFCIVLLGCQEGDQKRYLPSSIGPINSLAVVMDDDLWKGAVGDKVREHFAAPVLALTLNEPKFSINHFPPKTFTGTTRSSRSILYVMKDSLDLAHIKTDLYASPQRIGVVKGRTVQELIANIDAKAGAMIEAFKGVEIKENQKRFLKSLNKEGVLEKNFKVSIDIPSVYTVGRQEDNFVWFDRQILKGTANIVAYTVPGDRFKNDTTLVRDIVSMRDTIGKKFIPGPDNPGKVTYMRTEPAFAPHVFHTEIGGRKAIEVRGLWDVKNYPMAGPFLTYIIEDPEKNRKMVIEGFVFAPAAEKRDDMFELEAILKTIRF